LDSLSFDNHDYQLDTQGGFGALSNSRPTFMIHYLKKRIVHNSSSLHARVIVDILDRLERISSWQNGMRKFHGTAYSGIHTKCRDRGRIRTRQQVTGAPTTSGRHLAGS
jgi:hypothetical protein